MQYEYDLFISYAHIDDESPFGGGKGWIGLLHVRLSLMLAQALGYRLNIWRDELRQRGYGVLPEQRLPVDERRRVEEAVRADLARSCLSVHMVGARYGSTPEDDPASVVQIQERLAAEGPGYLLFNRRTETAYGRPEFVDLIRAVAAEWAKRHPDLRLVVADLSLRGGGPFPAHGGDHQDGREADIWPVTNNGQPEPTNVYAPNYSRELTTELIRLILQVNPAAVVYFDDPPLVSAGLVRATLDHNNYIHVYLPKREAEGSRQ